MNFRSETLLGILEQQLKNKHYTCSKCGGKAIPNPGKDFGQRCAWKLCGLRENFLKNTPFYHSRIETIKVLQIIWLWCEGVKRKTISKISEVSKSSISSIIGKLKDKLKTTFWLNFKQIGGPGVIVEIDESKFGRRKYNRGHQVEGVWVFGLVERTSLRRIVLIPVEQRNKQTLEKILKKYVHKDSIIHSDCWRAYSDLSNHFAEHRTVNHSQFFVNPDTGVHTNTIEGNWSSIKDKTPKTSRTKKDIELSLIKYMLERNSPETIYEEVIKMLLR